MALANGIVLVIGSLLIGAPIILHLLMQPKPKLTPFPALRFVRQRQQSNRRQIQLRHWILLFLRCLVIATLVLALAGISAASVSFGSWATVGVFSFVALIAALLLIATLLWTRPINKLLAVLFGLILILALGTSSYLGIQTIQNPTARVLGNRVAPVSAVMIIDTSPRMMYMHENQTRLAKAQELSKWLIEQLPEDSQVSIAIPDGTEPFFSVDLSAAEKRLDTIKTDFDASSLVDTIGPTLRLLENSANERREVYIVSDLTKLSWRNAENIKPLAEKYPDVTFYLIDVGVEDPINSTIGPIEVSSEVVSQSATVEISSRLEMTGPNEGGVVTLYLEKQDLSRPYRTNGKTVLPDEFISRPQVIGETGANNVALKFTLDERLPPGTHHGWIEFPNGDGLELDNRRYFTIQMRPAWNVLVVAPHDVSSVNLVETISPQLFRDSGTQEFNCVVIDQVKLSRMTANELTQYQAVFLLDPAPIGEGGWNLLANFAEKGGGIAIFLGWRAAIDGAVAEDFNSKSAKRIMPGRVSNNIWRRREDENRFLVVNSSTHPITRPFIQAASSIRWNLLPIHRHWGLLPFEDNDDENVGNENLQVLFRFSNQVPAVVEKQIGLGRSIVVTTPITEPNNPPDRQRWNDLFFDQEQCWPSFWLIDQIARYLVSSQPVKLNLELGEPAVLDNDEDVYPDQYFLFAPRDEEPVKLVADNERIRFKFTDYPGQYRLAGNRNGPVRRGFSVNLAEGTTRLDRIDPTLLNDWFGDNRIQIARNQEEIEREQGAMRVGREFYPILVVLVTIFLGMELLLSNRFYDQGRSNTNNRETSQ